MGTPLLSPFNRENTNLLKSQLAEPTNDKGNVSQHAKVLNFFR
jgi:hypothetical protein